jgi:hypothetical protein
MEQLYIENDMVYLEELMLRIFVLDKSLTFGDWMLTEF